VIDRLGSSQDRCAHRLDPPILGLSLAIGGAIAAVTLVAMVTGATGTATPYVPLSGWVAVIMGPMLLASAGTLLPILRIIRLPTTESIDATE